MCMLPCPRAKQKHFMDKRVLLMPVIPAISALPCSGAENTKNTSFNFGKVPVLSFVCFSKYFTEF